MDVRYGMLKWSANLNHIAYADNTIIFVSAHTYFLRMIMNDFAEYETQSGQKINKVKSAFYMHQYMSNDLKIMVEHSIGVARRKFPLIYLVCPITHTILKEGPLFWSS